MNTKTGSNAERFGRGLARMWRSYIRRERRVANWLVEKRLPAKGAIALLWIVKLAVFVVLLYTTLWLVLLFALVVIAAWLARHPERENDYPEPEWRNGNAGYGLYTYDGHRIDPHVHDDEN
jgi:hypothetical protein